MMRNGALHIAIATLTIGSIVGTLSASGPTSQPAKGTGDIRATISDLRRESMTPPACVDLGSELDKAIGRLKLPTTRHRKPSEASHSQPAAAATTQPTSAASKQSPPAPTSRPAETRRQPAAVSPETLAKLRKAAADGKTDPVKLADDLFVTDQLDGAYAIYEMVMESKPEKETAAWILFQMGNCKRSGDPAAARKLYRKLTVDQPDSPWTPLARMQDNLLQWYTQRLPDKVLKEIDDHISNAAATTGAPATRKDKTTAKQAG